VGWGGGDLREERLTEEKAGKGKKGGKTLIQKQGSTKKRMGGVKNSKKSCRRGGCGKGHRTIGVGYSG